MSHFTKYGKRMRLMLLTAMFVASMVCLFAIPFVEKNLLNNQVAYYRIEVNGTENLVKLLKEEYNGLLQHDSYINLDMICVLDEKDLANYTSKNGSRLNINLNSGDLN